MKKKISILIKYIEITILFLTFCSSSKNNLIYQIEETEKNDTLNTANTIVQDSIVYGSFDNPKDKDIFLLDLTKNKIPNQQISIHLDPIKEFDTRIILYKNKKVIKIIDDFKKNEAEILPNLNLENTIYHIEISIGYHQYIENLQMKDYNRDLLIHQNLINQKKSYQLKISKITDSNLIENEPNDYPFESNKLLLIPNNTTKGFFRPFFNWSNNAENIQDEFIFLKNNKMNLQPWIQNNIKLQDFLDYDLDWYEIQSPKTQMISIHAINKTNHINLILALYDNEKNLLIWNDASKIGENEKIQNFFFKTKKPYLLLILGIPTNQHILNSRDDFHYEILIESILNNTNIQIETEPNDTLNNLPLIDTNIIEGYLNNKTDKDCFKINLALKDENLKKENTENPINTKEKYFSLDLFFIDELDPQIELYDPKKNLLKIYNSHSAGYSEKIYQSRLDNMDFAYVCIQQFFIGNSKRNQANYRFEYSITNKKDLNLEIEFNDDLYSNLNPNSENNLIHINQEIKGYINPPEYKYLNINQKKDLDIYKIRLEKNETYEVIVKNTSNINLEVKLYHFRDKNYIFPYKEMIFNGKEEKKILIRKLFKKYYQIPP